MTLTRAILSTLTAALLCAGCQCGINPVEELGPTSDAGDGGGSGGGAGGGVGGSVGGGSGGDDGGSGCGANACGACPATCTPLDVCVAGQWLCTCACADGGTGGGTGGGAGGGTGGSSGGGVGGGTGGAVDAGSDAGVTPADVCLDVARRECDFMIRCAALADVNGLNFVNGRTNAQVASAARADCEARIARDRGCVIAATGWAVGRASLDQVKYFDCVNAAYPASTCDRDAVAIIRTCVAAPFITGLAATGGLCIEDNNCAAGFCSVQGGNACGTCQAFLSTTAGPNCTRDAQCDKATSYCPGVDTAVLGQTTSGFARCAAWRTTGTSCTVQDLIFSEACGPGKVCTGTLGNYTCQPAKAPGAVCTRDRWECERSGRLAVPEYTCRQVGSTQTCQPSVGPRDVACDNGDSYGLGRVGECLETQYCSSGLCTNRRTATQPCTGDVCAQGLACTGGQCTAYTDVGGACTTDGQCKSMLFCAGTSCARAFALLGQACSTTVRCAEGSCTNGTCAVLRADGATCTTGSQCQSYVCTGSCVDACWD